jgi:hypothetical protein
MIPFANATLTTITAAAIAEDYDQAAVPGDARWTGALGIYVSQELTQTEGDGVDEIITTRLEIPYAIGQLVQRGDTLTYTFETAAHARVARNLIRSELVGRVRVILENA